MSTALYICYEFYIFNLQNAMRFLVNVNVKVYLKVKFTLKQATKSKRGSRGIAVLFP